MTSAQTGAAPVMPLTFHIGSPVKFPTQTPTVYRLEYPIHQLSLISLLVPVLTAVQKRVAKGFSRPKVRLLAPRSERISEMRKAASFEKTFREHVVTSFSLVEPHGQSPWPSAAGVK